ncbi:multiple organellar RNA editing factor 8, chloroplastic/mitochondrial-like protein [Tanacetum coccineum]
MTTRVLLRRLISKTQTLTTHHHHSFSTTTILRLRPLITAATLRHAAAVIPTSSRALSTCETTSSLNDQTDPNWKNRPPKEWILLDGCDFEHWFIFVEKPEGEPTRDEIIDSYINTLAKALGLSYDDARMKIYSVSTRYYFAFGALISEEDSDKLKVLPGVRWVLPDSYSDLENKQYDGEPTRDEIIDSYINTLAKALGLSYDDARMKIYSVSTRCYYAFGALVSEEDSYKLKGLPGVRWVLPDSYLDVENKQYEGEPFIDGKAVPYDPKYHEEWIRENARRQLQESKRNRRNDKE